jgi:esterase/lipase
MSANPSETYALNPQTYEWSARAFRLVSKWLRVNLKLHHERGQLEAGDIFLFNHFARVETFIPQYLIYDACGALCRSVASAEFFRGNDSITRYLVELGVVPNNHPQLLLLLAGEILKGRKVVIFPEGGMVKDRRVVDEQGGYSVYSRKANVRRKHHTGAALLAVLLDAFKAAVLADHARHRYDRLHRWAGELGIDGVERLVAAARKPTVIVPANITFYPLHIDDNILQRGVERFAGAALTRRASEELLIEGNILLRKTDMDIRLGDPQAPASSLRWWQRWLLRYLGRASGPLSDFFALVPSTDRWDNRLLARGLRQVVGEVRDRYMRGIYTEVTINLSHLAAHVIACLYLGGSREIDQVLFRRMIYLAVKRVQGHRGLHLHRGLRNPVAYDGIIDNRCGGLEHFIHAAMHTGLAQADGELYRFSDKLTATPEFDEIRRRNPVVVYYNESAPIRAVRDAAAAAVAEAPALAATALARLQFDDELLAFQWDRRRYTRSKHEAINRQETATESGAPYLLVPEQPRRLGVLMVHGFLASPAELRPFAEQLAGRGFPVMGVRLKGHGTSPWDLRERGWRDWLASVRRGYEILRPFAERICVIGFSTGGALSLLLAAEEPHGLAGIAVCSVPVKFRNRNLIFVPLLHTANKLFKWVTSEEGPFPFRVNESEHPHINYRHIPIRGLYELTRMVDTLEHDLARVHCPALILQASGDRVVDPKSAQIVHRKLGGHRKTVHMVDADRHGILNEDIGETRRLIDRFVDDLAAEVETRTD